MSDDRKPKDDQPEDKATKESFDLETFLKEAIKAGEILEKKEKEEKKNDHVTA